MLAAPAKQQTLNPLLGLFLDLLTCYALTPQEQEGLVVDPVAWQCNGGTSILQTTVPDAQLLNARGNPLGSPETELGPILLGIKTIFAID